MKYKILLVEDNNTWQKLLDGKICRAVQNLSDADCDIKLVDNFDDAYIALEESCWDLLVTDLGLGNDDQQPQKLGKQIVEIAHEKNIRAIVVSGTAHLNPMDVRDALTILGASDFFYKYNFDSQDFIKQVQEILQNQQQLGRENSANNDNYQLSDKDRQYLVKTLYNLATHAIIPAKEYFKKLVQELRYPEDWKESIAKVWTGDANCDAEGLIKWCEQKKIFPQDYSESSGYTVLGCLIEKLLKETGDRHLLQIIIHNQLITDKNILQKIKNYYS